MFCPLLQSMSEFRKGNTQSDTGHWISIITPGPTVPLSHTAHMNLCVWLKFHQAAVRRDVMLTALVWHRAWGLPGKRWHLPTMPQWGDMSERMPVQCLWLSPNTYFFLLLIHLSKPISLLPCWKYQHCWETIYVFLERRWQPGFWTSLNHQFPQKLKASFIHPHVFTNLNDFLQKTKISYHLKVWVQ